MVRRQPDLKDVPFVMAAPARGRMVIKAANIMAQQKGIDADMVVADCRAILPSLQVFDDKPELTEKLLNALAGWCLRYTPVVAIHEPEDLVLDISGCAHLWGGEKRYLSDIVTRLRGIGYDVRVAIADTIGAAWAVCHFGTASPLVAPDAQLSVLQYLPPAALRLDILTLEKLQKLGLYQVADFVAMPRKALRRRFGAMILTRLDQAVGSEIEVLRPIQPAEPYQERLPSLEPIRTATGIEIALKQLLDTLCRRLAKEEKGLRKCIFKCYRIDGLVQQIEIGTNRPSRNVAHLFKLFELKIVTIAPALGIEVFTLEATIVEDVAPAQDALWNFTIDREAAIGELLDRMAGKLGADTIRRYLPDEHYWPERSFRVATSLSEQSQTSWRTDAPRPIHLLTQPELIEVTVPMPDYPPMLFIYKGELHNISRADGPERIEQEWWLQQGLYRDYYCVEDSAGGRYWIFRAGSYEDRTPQWFVHGFFA